MCGLNNRHLLDSELSIGYTQTCGSFRLLTWNRFPISSLDDSCLHMIRFTLRVFLFLAIAWPVATAMCNSAKAATATERVRMYFNVGVVDFDLYGNESPLHVENFLGYVNSNAYNRTWIHRSFCCGSLLFLQGGEFYIPEPGDSGPGQSSVVSGPPVVNEYDPNNGLINSPGTLAAARTSDLDSATNGWFINTTDNSTAFPNYTVFGEVTEGFEIVEGISSLSIGHPYLSSFGFDTAPVFNNFYVYLMQVVERSLVDGDFDFDNSVGASDFEKWGNDYGRLLIAGPDFDHDKKIDGNDLGTWQSGYGQFDGVTTFAEFEQGDNNNDGLVSGNDFLAWQRNMGTTTDVSADGDGDYRIGGSDFLIWQRTFGQMAPVITAIPEPTTLIQLTGCLLLVLNRRSRRFSSL